MNTNNRVKPHGSELVDLLVDEERAHLLKEIALNLPDITLNERQMCDLELMATGAFSPLKGFMTRSDYESVLDRMRLQNDTLWPIPICMDVGELQARSLEAGQSIALRPLARARRAQEYQVHVLPLTMSVGPSIITYTSADPDTSHGPSS